MQENIDIRGLQCFMNKHVTLMCLMSKHTNLQKGQYGVIIAVEDIF